MDGPAGTIKAWRRSDNTEGRGRRGRVKRCLSPTTGVPGLRRLPRMHHICACVCDSVCVVCSALEQQA